MNDHSNLFYLTGFQRSGTTLLCHLLDKHPEIVCAEEPEFSKKIIFGHKYKLKDMKSDSIRKVIDHYGVDQDSYMTLVGQYLCGEMSEDKFLRSSYGLFNKKYAKWSGVKEVCDLSAYKHDFINKITGYHKKRLKFIFIERDIKGIAHSFMKLGFFPPRKRRVNIFNLKIFAKNYIKCLNYIKENIPADITYYVTYEDLLSHPANTLEGIFKFLDVTTSEDVINRIVNTPSRGIRQIYNGIITGNAETWRDKLSEKESVWLDKYFLKKSANKNFDQFLGRRN